MVQEERKIHTGTLSDILYFLVESVALTAPRSWNKQILNMNLSSY